MSKAYLLEWVFPKDGKPTVAFTHMPTLDADHAYILHFPHMETAKAKLLLTEKTMQEVHAAPLGSEGFRGLFLGGLGIN